MCIAASNYISSYQSQPYFLFAAKVGKPETLKVVGSFLVKGGKEVGTMKMVVGNGQEPVLEHLYVCPVVICVPSFSKTVKELESRLGLVVS